MDGARSQMLFADPTQVSKLTSWEKTQKLPFSGLVPEVQGRTTALAAHPWTSPALAPAWGTNGAEDSLRLQSYRIVIYIRVLVAESHSLRLTQLLMQHLSNLEGMKM